MFTNASTSNAGYVAPADRLPRTRRATLAAFAVLALAGLSGCAMVQSTPPGTSLDDVMRKFGAPTTTCKNADGTVRALWTQQPQGFTAYATKVGADGKVGPFQQMLTDANFDRMNEGTWPLERVLCEFGPPQRVERAGLGEKNEVVWSYRYMQSSTWYSLMYVYLGRDGKQVTHFHPGPDPEHTVWGDGGGRK